MNHSRKSLENAFSSFHKACSKNQGKELLSRFYLKNIIRLFPINGSCLKNIPLYDRNAADSSVASFRKECI